MYNIEKYTLCICETEAQSTWDSFVLFFLFCVFCLLGVSSLNVSQGAGNIPVEL